MIQEVEASGFTKELASKFSSLVKVQSLVDGADGNGEGDDIDENSDEPDGDGSESPDDEKKIPSGGSEREVHGEAESGSEDDDEQAEHEREIQRRKVIQKRVKSKLAYQNRKKQSVKNTYKNRYGIILSISST